MGLGRGIKPIGVLWAIAVVVVGSLNPLGFLLREMLHNPAGLAATQIETTEIKVPGSEMKTCHHHSEGCPKECFCPKVTPTEVHGEGLHLTGRLSTVVLTPCTEEWFGGDLWSAVLFFPISKWEFVSCEVSSPLGQIASNPLVSRYLDPLFKIPIV